MEYKKLQYQIFGSENSIDLDIMYIVPVIPSTKSECKKLIEELTVYYNNTYNPDKVTNINICTIDEETGTVNSVYKGTYDEVNNSLFFTYKRHKQEFPNKVRMPIDRHIDWKAIRILRFILSFFSRVPDLRVQIKEALREDDFGKKINILKNIEFSKYLHYDFKTNKKVNDFDVWKTIAFQLICGTQLFNRKEVCSKEGADSFIYRDFPELRKMLYRYKIEKSDLEILTAYCRNFINTVIKEHSKFEFIKESEYENKYKKIK